MALTERTPQEIKERIQQVAIHDIFGFEQSDLIDYLPFELAKPFLKEGVTAAEWEGRNLLSAQDAIRDYLPFAWGKANDSRGLSAQRSISHMKAWLWLAGFTQAADTLFDHFEYYGKPQLVLVGEIVGFNWLRLDNGHWTNSESDDEVADDERERLIAEAKEKAAQHLASVAIA